MLDPIVTDSSASEQPAGRASSGRNIGRQASVESFANEHEEATGSVAEQDLNVTKETTEINSDDATPPETTDDDEDDDLMLSMEQGEQEHSSRRGGKKPAFPHPASSSMNLLSRSDSSPDVTNTMDDTTSVHSAQSVDSTTKRQKRYLQMKVAVQEERQVSVAKRIMLVVLFLAAVALSLATYFVLRNEQEDEYQQQFRNYASEIVAVAKENVENSFGSIEAFANTITAGANSAGQTFPNVTIPDYTSKAIRLAELAANSRLVTYAPLVTANDRLGFEEYARQEIRPQIQSDLDYLDIDFDANDVPTVPNVISYFNLTAKAKFSEPEQAPGPFLVNWQRYPFEVEKGRVFVMNNMLRIPTIRSAVAVANATLSATTSFLEALLGIESQVIQPVFSQVLPPHRANEREMVGAVWVVLNWANYFTNLLPDNVNGIYVVLKSSCGFTATFAINGLNATNLGLGELHDTSYNSDRFTADFFNFDQTDAAIANPTASNEESDMFSENQQGTQSDNVVCVDKLTLELYPSDDFKESYESNQPIVFAVAVFIIFIFTTGVFLIFEWSVRARQSKVEQRLTAQDKIVSGLFPSTIRARLYDMNDEEANGGLSDQGSLSHDSSNHRAIKRDLDDPDILKSKPIADLYLETSVIFADIAGFTAWSSTREPGQVLRLLETIYGAFDKLARKHNVFKIETIGDCYVAVTGIPDHDKEHGINMARFARDILSKMKSLVKKLEVSLGPDTADLTIRIGIHSGQCTAGVLRGERSRFQLFGDTVNTAARMESTGKRSRIHISAAFATLLQEQGYGQWVRPREGPVFAQGKGELTTFWLESKEMTKMREKKSSASGLDSVMSTNKVHFEEDELQVGAGMDKETRLVEWIVEVFSGVLRSIVAARVQKHQTTPRSLTREEGRILNYNTEGRIVLEECVDVIELPTVGLNDLAMRGSADTIVLPPKVIEELRRYITAIAHMYHDDNPFHNFEHASHVTASTHKLLSRIVTVDTTYQTQSAPNGDDMLEMLTDHSYGITNDPLTQLAVLFSAIIHDVDHPGVSNGVLVKENNPMSIRYKETSVAEQNSVDLAWQLLMEEDYGNLRGCIYTNTAELQRFRQLVVNAVMATDVMDKKINAARKERWNKAFSDETAAANNKEDDDTTSIQEQAPPKGTATQEDATLVRNRKATIVIEHLIQASDVSHTMQHWAVYLKWNKRFFMECMKAYEAGRMDTDPSLNWYQGEIGFFNFYVIPLAKKLDNCQVFGVSSHEYLGYAKANRDEWVKRGEQLVQDYLKSWEAMKNTKDSNEQMMLLNEPNSSFDDSFVKDEDEDEEDEDEAEPEQFLQEEEEVTAEA